MPARNIHILNKVTICINFGSSQTKIIHFGGFDYLEESMANNSALLLNNGGRLDGVGSQVGVGDWGVDGGNNGGNNSGASIVVVWVVCVVGISIVVSWGISWGIKKGAGISLGLTLDKGVSDNVALLLDDAGGLDGVGSQVGVGDVLVGGGNNRGNNSGTSVVVVWVVGISVVVSWGVEKAAGIGIGLSFTLSQTVVLQGLDGASLSCDAVVRSIRTDLGNNSRGSSVGGIGVGVVAVRRSSQENLGISLSFPLVQTVDVCVTSGVVVSISAGNGGAIVERRIICVWVVRRIKELGIGFRLGQAKRGDGENYDLENKERKT